ESAQSRGPEGERQLESILFHGGPIRTMMHDQDMPEAVLVQGGRVTATGDRAELARMGTSFEIDLDGRTLLPGIVDIHPHLMQHGEQRDGMVDLSTARNHDDIIQRIAERARSTPPGQWIQATPVGEPFYYITRNYRDLEE